MLDKTFVIGDVHGCYHTLKTLLEKLPQDARVIFVGDLCDRGLHSKEVFELVIEKGYEVIRGNHEDYMYTHAFEAIEGKPNRWIDAHYMGGKETFESYKGDIELFLKHREWIDTLPRYIALKDIFITHGFGLPYYKRRDTKAAYIGLLKNRITDEPEWGHDWEKEWSEYSVFNIFGHTVYEEPLLTKQYCGIDTGCGEGKMLTAMNLQTRKLIHVKTLPKDLVDEK